MRTRARDFFSGTVKPTVDEFLSDPTSSRRGRLAALVLYHMADYWALENYVGDDRDAMTDLLSDTRKRLVSKCSDFTIIGDIADATKHAQLFDPSKNKNPKPARKLSESGQVRASPGLFQAAFGIGVFGEAGFVHVMLNDGEAYSLEGLVHSVLTMWNEELGIEAATPSH
jgi:hypothetical protein